MTKATKRQNTRSDAWTFQRFMSRRAVLTTLIGGAGGALLVGGALRFSSSASSAGVVDESRKATIYKDPQCGCCEGYADYLRGNDFQVSIVPTHDLAILNDKYGIQPDLQPCHISLMAGYVVGGHVPIEVVIKLLAEKPKITGITLPGMPEGSPGMTGAKLAPLTIYVIGKSDRKVYAVV